MKENDLLRLQRLAKDACTTFRPDRTAVTPMIEVTDDARFDEAMIALWRMVWQIDRAERMATTQVRTHIPDDRCHCAQPDFSEGIICKNCGKPLF